MQLAYLPVVFFLGAIFAIVLSNLFRLQMHSQRPCAPSGPNPPFQRRTACILHFSASNTVLICIIFNLRAFARANDSSAACFCLQASSNACLECPNIFRRSWHSSVKQTECSKPRCHSARLQSFGQQITLRNGPMPRFWQVPTCCCEQDTLRRKHSRRSLA